MLISLGLAGEDISSRRYVGNLMIRMTKIVFLIMLSVSSAGIALAGDIYKWTDKDGNVHYGDRPAGEAPAETPAANSELASASKVLTGSEIQAATDEPTEPTREKLYAQALAVKDKCATYKARLRELLASRRSYTDDDDGERVYFDEDEIMAARERVQNLVEENCEF